jgi:tetratricopeptide (TPR) repeat protein
MSGIRSGSAATLVRGGGRGAATLVHGRALWPALLLVLATLAVFGQVRHHGFVTYDDAIYVTENPRVQKGLTVDNVAWAFRSVDVSNWHPLTWLSHMLDVQLFGMDAGAHHLTSLALHTVNVLLLFLVLDNMTGARWRSAVVAALFALHPLHVESVAYVAERKDVLSTCFWMLTLWAYARYVGRPSFARYCAVFLFLAAGLMAKPMLVTLPFVLLLLDFWPLERRLPVARLVAEKLPLVALAALASAVTYAAQKGGGSVAPLETMSLGVRTANALLAYATYIRKTFWPVDLACFYPYPRAFDPWRVGGAGVLLALISLAVVRLGRRHPYLPVGWFWYVGTLVPVIGLVQVGAQAMADHYTYVPLIGLFIMLVWGADDLLAPWRHRRAALASAGAVVLSACLVTTWLQVARWRSSVTLFEHALAVTADNYLAHNNLGLALQREGKLEQAVAQYSEALRIAPDYADARYNLGVALDKQGRAAEAAAQYSEVLRLVPDHPQAHNNLGNLLSREGDLDAAITHFEAALRALPDYVDAHVNLGAALRQRGEIDRAIAHYGEALRIRPEQAEAHYNLANVLAARGELEQAIVHYGEALRIKPDYAEAHNNLGRALAEQGRTDEAIAHYSEALRIDATLAVAYYNRAMAYRQRGEHDEAEADLRRARQLGAAPDQ